MLTKQLYRYIILASLLINESCSSINNNKEEIKPDKNKPEEIKPDKNKPEEIRQDKNKPEEIRPDKNKPEEIRPDKNKPEEIRPDKNKPEEIRQDKNKPEEIRPDKNKPEEIKPDKNKPEEIRPDKNKAEEIKPDKNKPEEIRPDKNKPEEIKPDKNKPEEIKPDKNQPEEIRPDKNKPEEIKPEGKSRDDNYSKIFKNPKNLENDDNEYISIDNLHEANSARLIIPKNKKIKNIFELLDNYPEEFKSITSIMSQHYKNGIVAHNTCEDKSKKQIEFFLINTNVCCSKPELFHIQEYSGYNISPYDKIDILDLSTITPTIQNDTFGIYDIPNPNKHEIEIDGTNRLLLLKDQTKTFDDFFTEITTSQTCIKDYADILSKYKNFEENNNKIHQNARMFIVPNKTKNPKYNNYQLPNNRFCMFMYSTQSTTAPPYAY